MSRIVYDCSQKLGTSEIDVWRLAMKYQLGSLQMDDVNKRYGYWLRHHKEPAWLVDFCISILTGKEQISKKELKPNLRFNPLRGGLQ